MANVQIAALNLKVGNKSRCPGIVFMDTSESAETTLGGSIASVKPDITGYPLVYLDEVKPDGLPEDGNENAAKTRMGLAALFFEIKKDRRKDFFVDPKDCDHFARPVSERLDRQLLALRERDTIDCKVN